MRKLYGILATAALFLTSLSAQAVVIEYELIDLGADSYRYDYTVDNTAGPNVFDGFGIDFDTALYDESSLVLTTPAGWDGIVLGSFAPFMPASADWLKDIGSVGIGDIVTGFSVTFDWLGGSTGPGAQSFYTYDGATFDTIDTGMTTLKTVSTPEPGVLMLLGFGLVGVSFARRVRKV